MSIQSLAAFSDKDRVYDLEYNLRTCQLILDKVLKSKNYAQNLYAAMCNVQWCRKDVFSILRDDYWGCTWRHAGAIVADMRGQGDYMEWYMSGISIADYHEISLTDIKNGLEKLNFVAEGQITREILEDLAQLGWQPINSYKTQYEIVDL